MIKVINEKVYSDGVDWDEYDRENGFSKITVVVHEERGRVDLIKAFKNKSDAIKFMKTLYKKYPDRYFSLNDVELQ